MNLQAGVLSGKLQYGTAFGGSKVCIAVSMLHSTSRYPGRGHVAHPDREWLQLCWQRHAHVGHHRRANGSLRVLWANILPEAQYVNLSLSSG